MSLNANVNMKKEINIDDIHEAFKKVLHKLSPLEVLVCYLKIERNLTLKEISSILFISRQTIKNYLDDTYKSVRKVCKNDISK